MMDLETTKFELDATKSFLQSSEAEKKNLKQSIAELREQLSKQTEEQSQLEGLLKEEKELN